MNHYKTSSLSAFAAFLICLENSFWHMQQGSTDGFTIAFNAYPRMEMDTKIISQWPNDWFSIAGHPSQKERTEFIDFILANLLVHPKSVV